MRPTRSRSWFTRLTKWTAHVSGRSSTFILAVLTIVIWALTGPMFGFSNTWQLVINTGTTIVTFLMVFLIQSTQNRDAEAMQIKLDEIIRSIEGAKNELLDLEELEDEDLEQARDGYEKLAAEARKALRGRTRRQPGPRSTD
jgi:low affinity Fe/Cu permease